MHFPLKKFFDVCDVNIFAIIAQVYFSIFAKIIIFNVALHKKQMAQMTSITSYIGILLAKIINDFRQVVTAMYALCVKFFFSNKLKNAIYTYKYKYYILFTLYRLMYQRILRIRHLVLHTKVQPVD